MEKERPPEESTEGTDDLAETLRSMYFDQNDIIKSFLELSVTSLGGFSRSGREDWIRALDRGLDGRVGGLINSL